MGRPNRPSRRPVWRWSRQPSPVSDHWWRGAFHARAAATGKARLPGVVRRVDGTTSVEVEALRRRRREPTSVVRWRVSARYDGAVPLRQRYARTHNRNWILSGTFSQCSSRRSGVELCASLHFSEVVSALWRSTCGGPLLNARRIDTDGRRPSVLGDGRCWRPDLKAAVMLGWRNGPSGGSCDVALKGFMDCSETSMQLPTNWETGFLFMLKTCTAERVP